MLLLESKSEIAHTILTTKQARFSWNYGFFKLSVEQLLILIDHRLRFKKKISLSKKMSLVVSIASPGLLRFSKHDLEWPLSGGCWKLLSVFFIVYIQLKKKALKVHIKNNLWPLGQYIKASVWYFPVMTERTRLISGIYCSEIKYIYIYITSQKFRFHE